MTNFKDVRNFWGKENVKKEVTPELSKVQSLNEKHNCKKFKGLSYETNVNAQNPVPDATNTYLNTKACLDLHEIFCYLWM